MNDQELLRIIDFIGRTRTSFKNAIPAVENDSDWAIVSHLVKSQLLDRPVKITDLIAVSGLAYGTGSRRIHKMIADGLIDQQMLRPPARAHSLTASQALRLGLESFAYEVKVLLSQTLGMRGDSSSADDYFFGESRQHLAELLPPTGLGRLSGVGASGPGLKFLFHDDNFFTSLRNLWTDFRSNAGTRRDFTLVDLPHLYETLLKNATLPVSAFDVVAVNFPWVPELASKDMISPFDADLGAFEAESFHSRIWNYAAWRGEQFGIPLFVTVEALAARKDLFEAGNLAFPKTLKDLLAAAKRLNSPKRKVAGIAWNGARGIPVASSFMFLLSDFGGTVVARATDDVRAGGVTGHSHEGFRSMLESPAARASLKFMHQLLEFSSPDVLNFNGDRTMYEFMAGRSAMAFAWSMRAARFEFDLLSRVKGQVEYLPHPNVSGVRRVVPLGGFVLAIPSNLPKERAVLAAQAIRWMTSGSTARSHVRNGIPLIPDFSVNSDPDLDATSPIVTFVERLARQDLLSTCMRPQIAVSHLIEEILGEEIHDALTGASGDELALKRASKRVQAVLDQMA